MIHGPLPVFLAATLLALPMAAAAQERDDIAERSILGGDGFDLSFSAQINRGILLTDDGAEDDAFFVDNDNSSSRFTLRAEQAVDDVTIGAVWVREIEVNSSSFVSQRNQWASTRSANRQLHVYARHPRLGEISIGKGDTASEDSAQIDLSGTGIAGFSRMDALASNIFFRRGDGTLSDVTVDAAFTNLDGLSRRERVLWRSPRVGRVRLSASAGDDGGDFRDIALRYDDGMEAFGVTGVVAWYSGAGEVEGVTGSVSALHRPTGLNVTLGAGERTRGGAPDVAARYVKLGWQGDGVTDLGRTALSVDWGRSDDVLAPGDAVTGYGLQAVQTVERIDADLFLGVRRYELDRPEASFQAVDAMQFGTRFRF
jgi:hypothetical protein